MKFELLPPESKLQSHANAAMSRLKANGISPKGKTMSTATKFVPGAPGEGPIPSIDLDAHQKDLARRKAERDAKKGTLMQCINPAIATKFELQKPVFLFTVEATWFGPGENGPGLWGPEKRSVIAQNESDAWAMFCDKIEQWPSRRDATVSIKRGKQMTAEDALTALGTGGDHELPRYTAGVSRKSKGRKL